MSESKAWNWKEVTDEFWLMPSEESYYIANRWKEKGYRNLLDFGCGLGRHSIFFAKEGFSVSAFDLSGDGVENLNKWANKEGLLVNTTVADMLDLPYGDNSFDCIFAYHVISHTDTAGMLKIVSEIKRILKPEGEIFLTLCSKETWSFKDAGYPEIDQNTVVKTSEGPEKGIPHFYVSLHDILNLFKDFSLERIRHTDDCYFAGKEQNSKHYFILASKI
jgi:2-polyprenyl-3-methyl-5-hydroxy-6-metoxy-1,4-benzoquinol methylase